MRKLKIFGIILFILVLFASGGLYYLKKFFIPGPFKEILISKAHETLSRDVQINELGFSLTHGVFLKGVRIADKEPQLPPLITIDEVTLGLPVPDLFHFGDLIFPFATIHKPSIQLKRFQDNHWNFSDLLPNSSITQVPLSTPKAKITKKSKLIIAYANIEQGQISIIDEHDETTQTISELTATAQLGIHGDLGFKASLSIPEHSTHIKLDGKYNLNSKNCQIKVYTQNLDAGYFIKLVNRPMKVDFHQAIINEAELNLDLTGSNFTIDGYASTPLDLTIHSPIPVTLKTAAQIQRLSLRKQDNFLKIRGHFAAPAMDMTIGKDKTLSGTPDLKNITVNIDLGKSITVDGDLTLNDGQMIIGADRKFAGSLTATELHIEYIGDDVALSGNFTNSNTNFSWPGQELTGELHWQKATLKKNTTTLTMTGDGQVLNGKFKKNGVVVAGDLMAKQLAYNLTGDYLQLTTPTADLFNTKILIADRKISGSLFAKELTLNYSRGILQTQAHLQTKTINLSGPADFIFTGNPDLQLGLTYNPQLNENALAYNGTIIFKNDIMQGLTYVDVLSNLEGKLHFTTHQAETDALTFKVGSMPMTLAGNLKNFMDPEANVTITSKNVELPEIAKIFANQLATIDLTITGQATPGILKFNGKLNNIPKGIIKTSATLNNVELTSSKLPAKILALKGQVEYDNTTLNWDQLKFSFKDQDYTSTGSLKNLQNPEINAHLSSGDFDFLLTAQKDGPLVSISSLKGKYHDTQLDLKGTLGLREGPADIDLSGQIKLNMIDLKFLPGLEDQMQNIHPLGSMNIIGRVTLPASSWQKMLLDLKINSNQISFYGYTFDLLAGQVSTLDDNRHNINLSSNFYTGKLTIDGKIALPDTSLPTAISAEMTDIDLALLKNDVPSLKSKDFSGQLSANLNASGPIFDLNNVLGNGAIHIKDGRLLELNLLKGIWKYLLIKEFKNVVFTDARSTFKVKDGKLITDDLIVKSTPVDFNGEGWLDFKGNLNFSIGAKVHESPLAALDSIKAAPTAIIAQAQNYMGIKLTGTLSEPKTKVKALPLKAIEKTTGSIIQGIGAMMEDILQ